MKTCHLTFLSKNKNSLDKTFLFYFNNSSLNLNVVKKYFQKQKQKHFLTILKSPHVNKKAQEQFETNFFSKQLSVYFSKKFKYIFFLKKIQNNLFSDVKLKLKLSVNEKKKAKVRFQILNIDNFKLDINKNFISQKNGFIVEKKKKSHLQNFNNQHSKNIKNYLKLFDSYGELKNLNN